MQTLTIATNVNCGASTTSTPVDMEAQETTAFMASATPLAVLSLNQVTRSRIRVEASDTSTFPSTDRKTLLDLNLTTQTAEQTRVALEKIVLSTRYIRVSTTAATGATGNVSLVLLGT